MASAVLEDSEQDSKDEETSTSSTHECKEEWLKNRIGYNTRYLEDLKHEKHEEQDSEDGLSNGKRKWYNIEIQETEQKVSELHDELKEVSA